MLRKPRRIRGLEQKRLRHHCRSLSLGYKDSNLEMTESESVALPFGDTPMFRNRRYYIIEFFKMQELFLKIEKNVKIAF